jgi:acetylornithine deacetylase/succinyl-diaminopimelate desuccinylase-like protein
MTMATIQQVMNHARSHQDEYLKGFRELLSIPSVSTDPAYRADLERCADWIVAEMSRIGLKECRKIATAGQPVIYGEWLEAGEDKPTVLIYAHYDVQPVDPLDKWITPPFEPTIRQGKLFARGTIDDKVGVYLNLKAIESMLAVDGRLPLNVKLFFEGEEETGSPHMLPFVVSHKELLQADLLLLCDGGFDPQQPQHAAALRGIVVAEVVISGPEQDLHSGRFGGTVHNPLHMVGQIVGSFHDASGRVQIPGFYDRVRPLSQEEMASMEETWALVGDSFRADAGVTHFWGIPSASLPERATALPTLDVNGIWGGYQGEGSKTVIPAQAGFKVTMRLVADQDPHEVGQLFRSYVSGFDCETLDIQVDVSVEAWPFSMALDGPAVEAIQKSFEETVGRPPLLVPGGGSIPIGGMFQRELGLPITIMGLGSGGGGHSPNEYLNLEHLQTGIELVIRFNYHFSEKGA